MTDRTGIIHVDENELLRSIRMGTICYKNQQDNDLSNHIVLVYDEIKNERSGLI